MAVGRQEKVITVSIKKLTSTRVLSNTMRLSGNTPGSVQTDMQLPTMMNLINTQLETGGSYEGDISSDYRSKDEMTCRLMLCLVTTLCHGVGSSQLDQG